MSLPHLAPRLLSLASVVLVGLFGTAGCQAESANGPRTPPPPPESSTQNNPVEPVRVEAVEPTAEGWLTFLEASAGELQTLVARVTMTKVIDLLDDETVRYGDLKYAAADGTHDAVRFAVRFTHLKIDDEVQKIDQAYIFDGRWLLDLDAQDRTATRRELVAEGERADLGLGDGPFLIPLNLKKDRLLQRFEVELIEADEDDPQTDAGCFHLRLIPRPGVATESQQLDLWFDREDLLPRRAASLEDDGDQTIVDLSKLVPNADLDADAFDTELPTDRGWQLQVVPMD